MAENGCKTEPTSHLGMNSSAADKQQPKHRYVHPSITDDQSSDAQVLSELLTPVSVDGCLVVEPFEKVIICESTNLHAI